MNSIQHNTQTAKSQLIVKVRANLYQLPQGQLVGFGPLESENGTSTCWTCFEPECEHVEAQSIPFNGIAPEDDEGMIFASSAGMWPDDYAIELVTL